MLPTFVLTNPVINNLIGNYETASLFTDEGTGTLMQILLRNLISAILVIAGIYFFIQILLGGFEYISAGGEKDSVQKASSRIKNALIGIAITLSVYAIAWTVGTIFGISLTQLNIPSLNP